MLNITRMLGLYSVNNIVNPLKIEPDTYQQSIKVSDIHFDKPEPNKTQEGNITPRLSGNPRHLWDS